MTTTVTVLAKGPLKLTGDFQVTNAEGTSLPAKSDGTYLCRCGASANKPFCDGAHKKTDFAG